MFGNYTEKISKNPQSGPEMVNVMRTSMDQIGMD